MIGNALFSVRPDSTPSFLPAPGGPPCEQANYDSKFVVGKSNHTIKLNNISEFQLIHCRSFSTIQLFVIFLDLFKTSFQVITQRYCVVCNTLMLRIFPDNVNCSKHNLYTISLQSLSFKCHRLSINSTNNLFYKSKIHY